MKLKRNGNKMKDTIPQLREDIDRIERMTLDLYKRLDALQDKEKGVD